MRAKFKKALSKNAVDLLKGAKRCNTLAAALGMPQRLPVTSVEHLQGPRFWWHDAAEQAGGQELPRHAPLVVRAYLEAWVRWAKTLKELSLVFEELTTLLVHFTSRLRFLDGISSAHDAGVDSEADVPPAPRRLGLAFLAMSEAAHVEAMIQRLRADIPEFQCTLDLMKKSDLRCTSRADPVLPAHLDGVNAGVGEEAQAGADEGETDARPDNSSEEDSDEDSEEDPEGGHDDGDGHRDGDGD